MQIQGPARVSRYAGTASWELERLREAGIDEVGVVDLSLPEFGIPVVRVVVPGLEAPCDHPGRGNTRWRDP